MQLPWTSARARTHVVGARPGPMAGGANGSDLKALLLVSWSIPPTALAGPTPALQAYSLYARSHLYFAAELILMLVLLALVGSDVSSCRLVAAAAVARRAQGIWICLQEFGRQCAITL